ncbi:pyrimidine/purine nucleoside phosphorylase [Pontibacter sp. 13R65]|uniref:pyrimidine/purine nucleoside phosphorylase n=1 Tax=Pontibacter sp. 13R65 TaxID=3127458 RepID=UPI00301C02D4
MIKVNEYFDGAVKSLGYQTAAGRSSVGVINEGEYEFGTSEHEIMHIIEGELKALLPGEQEWQSFGPGQHFEVPANASFKVQAAAPTAYLCQYR